MADNEETHVEKKTTEIDEVQDFAGGHVQSVEPVAEVHEELHHYSGGQIVEHSNTTISPMLWGFWAIVIVTIIGVIAATGSIPYLHAPSSHYTAPTAVGTSPAVPQEMRKEVLDTSLTTTPGEQYISMTSLNNLIGNGQSVAANVDAGSKEYQSYCIGCHGPNQDGAGPNSISLNPQPRNFRNAPFMQALSFQRINTSIHMGVPGTAMPRWQNTLTDDQIYKLIIYVLSLTAPQDSKGNFVDPLSGVGASQPSPSVPAGAGAMRPSAGSGSAMTQPEAPSGLVGSPPPAAPNPKM